MPFEKGRSTSSASGRVWTPLEMQAIFLLWLQAMRSSSVVCPASKCGIRHRGPLWIVRGSDPNRLGVLKRHLAGNWFFRSRLLDFSPINLRLEPPHFIVSGQLPHREPSRPRRYGRFCLPRRLRPASWAYAQPCATATTLQRHHIVLPFAQQPLPQGSEAVANLFAPSSMFRPTASCRQLNSALVLAQAKPQNRDLLKKLMSVAPSRPLR